MSVSFHPQFESLANLAIKTEKRGNGFESYFYHGEEVTFSFPGTKRAKKFKIRGFGRTRKESAQNLYRSARGHVLYRKDGESFNVPWIQG